MLIFVIYEWCYAVLGAMLHRKIRKTGSLLLAAGLVAMAFLVTLRLILICSNYAPDSVFLTKILPILMMVVPLFTLTGLSMVVFRWEEYTRKEG